MIAIAISRFVIGSAGPVEKGLGYYLNLDRCNQNTGVSPDQAWRTSDRANHRPTRGWTSLRRAVGPAT
jgi:hypothetical protein